MDSIQKELRAVNFDLREADLKRYYSSTNPKGAYGRIAKFFEEQGFEHRQYSGYTSKEPISDAEMIGILDLLFDQMKWLDKCTEKMDVTVIAAVYDYKKIREAAIAEKNMHLQQQDKNNLKPKESLKDLIARKQEQAKELNESRHETKEHSHDRNKDTI